MRIDQNLRLTVPHLTARQHFFLGAWFNMVNHASLDSYRLKAMNPLNIVREFSRISVLQHADDRDKAAVAEEAIEILGNHPVLLRKPGNYKSLSEVHTHFSEGVSATKKEKSESIFKQKFTLIQSFVRELDESLKVGFLKDTFDWLEEYLSAPAPLANKGEEDQMFARADRVCRDMLSVTHDDGFSLESLYGLYKLMQAPSPTGENEAPPYNFMASFNRVRAIMVGAPRTYQAFFAIDGMPQGGGEVAGDYGDVKIAKVLPDHVLALFPAAHKKISERSWKENNQRIFAEVTVSGRDGRSAGLVAFRLIGQLLDLIRYKYNAENLRISNDFLLLDQNKLLAFPLPQLIPNPKSKQDAGDLGEFFGNLQAIGLRDQQQTESRDRILAAFRLYRIGTNVTMFENKLVNWWTAIEYLAKGSKGVGAIGAGVENALAPTLGLIYLSKHLNAYCLAFQGIGKWIGTAADKVHPSTLTNKKFYEMIRSSSGKRDVLVASANEPYLLHHLSQFIVNMEKDESVAALLKSHEQRVRWHIQRIYRARCDIVHSAQPVTMIGLLCANLEYYLRMTLNSMLISFQEIPTLRGPTEFFERKKYAYKSLLVMLQTKPGKGSKQSSLVLQDVLE